jgi:hypothetical protein
MSVPYENRKIRDISLAPGRYALSLGFGIPGDPLKYALYNIGVAVDIIEADFYANGQNPGPALGQVLVRSSWEIAQ